MKPMTQPRSRARMAAMTASAMFGLCLAGVVASPVANAIPSPDPPPTGGDPGWAQLAQQCYGGSMRACDRLADQTQYANAPVYHDYGFSCGGRVNYDPGDTESDYVTCSDQFG